jgi:hypothetical protein
LVNGVAAVVGEVLVQRIEAGWAAARDRARGGATPRHPGSHGKPDFYVR